MYALKNSNPTVMYLQAIRDLVEKGDTCSPRGKLIKELRPAAIEFTDPFNRVTFLGGRQINPFFQIAESLWILSGRADVQWLVQFNKNMKEFSDDGVWFNAPYGERLRSWGKNAAHNIIINPIDQMTDVYNKLLADKDTRQAVMVISNPSFDNSNYTIGEHGKDIACNLVVTLIIRNNQLNMTVFNRSNDAHWGLWGANLCQFTTIQETIWSWLKNSGNPDFKDLKMGTYCQMTNSLHIYLDDYGARCTTEVLSYYSDKHPDEETKHGFQCENEPRMSLNKEEFEKFLTLYWSAIDPLMSSDEVIQDDKQREQLVEVLTYYWKKHLIDDYWYFGLRAMIAYRLVRLERYFEAMCLINELQDCQWKISMVKFMKNILCKKIIVEDPHYEEFKQLYDAAKSSLTDSLVYPHYDGPVLKSYLGCLFKEV